eukprot:gene17108-20378_t
MRIIPTLSLIIILSLFVIVGNVSASSRVDATAFDPPIRDASAETGEETCDPSLGCQRNASILILSFLLVLFLAVLVVYGVISLNFHYLPESVAVVMYGALIGLVGRFVTDVEIIKHVATFDTEKFFLFLLPVIIFEVGFSLPKAEFFRHITPILLFATLGTLISFFGTGFGLYFLGRANLSLDMSMIDSLIFSSFSSATDPVSSIAIFKALNVDPMLYMIVLGESILNDAVSIILFKSLIGFDIGKLWVNILMFFGVSLGSIALGIVVALGISLVLKWLNIGKYPGIETLFVIMFAYIGYLLGDALNLSGILSSFFCGITFHQYGYNSMTGEAKHNATQLLRMGSFVCETIAFIYIGISLTMHDYHFSLSFFLWSILFIIVFRALSVFPITWVLNKTRTTQIPMPIQIVIWFSGLRGAISFSLSLSDEYTSIHAEYIKTNVLLLVIFTIFVFGLSTYPVLKVLKIKSSDIDESLEFIGKPIEQETKFNQFGAFFTNIDENYLQPFFTRNTMVRMNVNHKQQEGMDLSPDLSQSLVDGSEHHNYGGLNSRNTDVEMVSYDLELSSPNMLLNNNNDTSSDQGSDQGSDVSVANDHQDEESLIPSYPFHSNHGAGNM